MTKRALVPLAFALLVCSFVGWRVLIHPREPVAWADFGCEITVVGNRRSQDRVRGHARNIWDLQVYGQRIYLAGGSTTQNAGPIGVWAYIPAKAQFSRELAVDEEAIEVFRVLDGELYIPAADPMSGDTHKFYRLHDGTWEKLAGTPELAHVRDVALHNGRLIGIGNARRPDAVASAFVTKDRGQTFTAATNPAELTRSDNWFFSLFPYQDTLFATSIRFGVLSDVPSIHTFNQQAEHFTLEEGYTTSDFLPVTGDEEYAATTMRIWMSAEHQGALLYCIRTYSANRRRYQDMYNRSYGMFLKRDLATPPEPLVFPDDQAVGEDVIKRGETVYALANRHTVDGHHVVYVYELTALPADAKPTWNELVRFNCQNKARSFELLDGVFYFGLGCEPDEWAGYAGTLLAVRPEKS